nr:MAG TPA: AAA domain protein [Caudoviricetes sp.]
MKILKMDRGAGKTFYLIRLSAVLDSPILCATEQSKKYILDKAKEMWLEIPEPIVVNKGNFEIVMRERNADLLIDDLELVLKGLFGNNVIVATTSEPILEF